MRTFSVLSEEGQQLSEPAEVVARWFCYFASVLYVHSQFSQESVDRMPSFVVFSDLDKLPVEEEFGNAFGKEEGWWYIMRCWCLVVRFSIGSCWVCSKGLGERVCDQREVVVG